MNFKKIIALVLALSLCAATFSACGNKDASIPEGMKYASPASADYKFFVPSAWTPEEQNPTGVLLAKAEDNSSVSIQKTAFDSSYTSVDFYFRTEYFQDLSATLKNLKLLEEECATENQTFGKNEIAAAKYVYTAESDGAVYKIMQYFSVYENELYILTYNANESVFSEHLEDVSDIVKNFVFTNEDHKGIEVKEDEADSENEAEAPEGMQLITSKFLDSKLYVPESWTPVSMTGTLIAKAADNSNVSLQKMTPGGSYQNADDYFRKGYYEKYILTTFQNAVLLEDECNTENEPFGKDEVGSVKYVYTVESDGKTYKIMQYFSVNSGYLYILTYTAEESLFESHLEEVSSIVKNFEY